MEQNQEPWRRSAVELAAMIRAREVSCAEVMESVLGRIAACNGRINAIVADCSEAATGSGSERNRGSA